MKPSHTTSSILDRYEQEVLDFVAERLRNGESEQAIIAALRPHDFTKSEARSLIRTLALQRGISVGKSAHAEDSRNASCNRDEIPAEDVRMEVRYCQGSLLFVLVSSGIMLIVCICLLPKGGVLGIPLVLLFGLSAFVALRRQLRQGPIFTIARDGVHDHLTKEFMPWHEIRESRLVRPNRANWRCWLELVVIDHRGKVRSHLLDLSFADREPDEVISAIVARGRRDRRTLA